MFKDTRTLYSLIAQHLSQDALNHAQANQPNVHFCYVPRLTTSIAQPLDMTFFCAFKQRTKKEWTRVVVRQALYNADSLGVVAPLPQLETDLLHLVAGVLRALDTWEMRQACWRHLQRTDETICGI
eukprot:5542216-Amphidinium_carterae.6